MHWIFNTFRCILRRICYVRDDVHVLDESLCYLAGAIDSASDCGAGWRRQFIQKCRDKNIKIKFLDPTNKVTGLNTESHEEKQLIHRLKYENKWDDLRIFMRQIVREDHRSIDLSDFIVLYIDPEVHTCGSYFELQSALTEKKPYFIITKGGKEKTPAWLFGICDHNYFYNTIDEVIEELCSLNSGEKPLSERWVLFRQQLKAL